MPSLKKMNPYILGPGQCSSGAPVGLLLLIFSIHVVLPFYMPNYISLTDSVFENYLVEVI